MTKLTLDITMSLDGFIAGHSPRAEQPLGDGGERLHEWMYGLEAFGSARAWPAARPTGTRRSSRNRSPAPAP
jgi:hypothetical protein